MILRKIPLESFIEILQQLFEEGADYVDINGEENMNNKDVIKITVRPEYFADTEEYDNNANEQETQLETDYYYEDEHDNIDSTPLSDKDINDLI